MLSDYKHVDLWTASRDGSQAGPSTNDVELAILGASMWG